MSSSKILLLKQSNYTIDKQNPDMLLGKGSFGRVYKGFDNFKNIWVAIKQINLQLLEEYGDDMKSVILNEINVMKKFTKKMNEQPCQNLVKQYDCFRSDKFIYIVMELCHNGTLFDQLKVKKIYDEPEVIQLGKQLLQGLMYLQKMNIAHRDFKPENIFITRNQNNQQQKNIYKIGDFGFSAQKTSFNDVMGTYPYMAPQIFKKEEYTNKVDIWSLGVTLHQLLFGQLFYFGKNKWEIEDKVKVLDYTLNPQQKQKISTPMYNFLKLCLTKNKFQRPQASELINHQIFTSVTKKSSIFKILKFEIDKCSKMMQTAQIFERYQQYVENKRQTIFIQLYLLKYAYCSMNRVAYSVMNKQNYLDLPIQKFNELISVQNTQKWQYLNDLSSRVWKRSSQNFKQKFNFFVEKYLTQFKNHDQQLIKKAINQEPYQSPDPQIFANQLKKWIKVLRAQASNQKFAALIQSCQQFLKQFQPS